MVWYNDYYSWVRQCIIKFFSVFLFFVSNYIYRDVLLDRYALLFFPHKSRLSKMKAIICSIPFSYRMLSVPVVCPSVSLFLKRPPTEPNLVGTFVRMTLNKGTFPIMWKIGEKIIKKILMTHWVEQLLFLVLCVCIYIYSCLICAWIITITLNKDI